jgi:DNA primase
MLINNVPITGSVVDILCELKSQLHSNGISLLRDIKDTPDNVMITCPYHKGGQERKPSAGIKKSDGMFHCFTCGEVHTLQEVISFCFGKSEDIVGVFGWNWLLKNFMTVQIENRKELDLDLSRITNKSPKQVVSDEELDSYRFYHPYMWTRRMTREAVDIFDIGFDKKTQSITFPVRDLRGDCVFVARRSVNTKFFNYPSGAEKPVYGLYELSRLECYPSEVIICESMIDAITCWVYGKYAVALNGLGNELQFRQLREMPCRKFILATDNDDAGRAARVRLRKYIKNKIVTEYILPDGKKDINDLTKKEFENLQEKF